MSDTDTDRPTGEQVDAALHRAELRYATEDERTFAAEVRALRAELDNERARHAGLQEAFTNARQEIRDEEERGALLVAALDEARAALAARTPRPADKVEQRFAYLANLDPGWDSYGADKIDPAAIDTARSVLTSLATPVHICGTVEGGIMLAWDDEQVTVTIEPGSRLSASVGEMCAEPEAARTPQPAGADGACLITSERRRQMSEEGWTAAHDAGHGDGELVDAARAYLIAPRFRDQPPSYWPWHVSWWKPCPDDRVRELIKAGALIAAEIDRLRPPSAPLPAVPDGEDAEPPYTDTPEHYEMIVRVGSGRVTAKGAIARLVAHGHELTDRVALDYTAAELRHRSRQYGRSSDTIGSLRYRVIALEADRRGWIAHQLAASKAQPSTGEDVPARLDAAADALAPFESRDDGSARQAERHLRRAADWLNATSPTVRAAVAAALARPTGGQG